MYTTEELPFDVNLAAGVEIGVTPCDGTYAVQFAKFKGCCLNEHISGGAPFDWVERGHVRGVYPSQCSGCGGQGTGYTVSALHWVDRDATDSEVQALADAFAQELAADVEDARAKLVARLTKEANAAKGHVEAYLAAIAAGMDQEDAEVEHLGINGIRLGPPDEYPGVHFHSGTTITAWDEFPQSDVEYAYEAVEISL